MIDQTLDTNDINALLKMTQNNCRALGWKYFEVGQDNAHHTGADKEMIGVCWQEF